MRPVYALVKEDLKRNKKKKNISETFQHFLINIQQSEENREFCTSKDKTLIGSECTLMHSNTSFSCLWCTV